MILVRDNSLHLKTNRCKRISVAHHRRNVDGPDEVALWASGHVRLEYVGLSVDSCYFGAIFQKVDFFHRPVFPVEGKCNN